MKHPPLGPLRALVEHLERADVPCALGGSGLLLALGIDDVAHDWDLTTDVPLADVRRCVAALAPEHVGASGIHADDKLCFEHGTIELIVRFSIRSAAGVTHLPTRVHGRWNGIPIGSPEVWAAAYALLGREAKAARLLAWLEAHHADRDALAAVLDQPLPAPLAARLAALPVRAASRGT